MRSMRVSTAGTDSSVAGGTGMQRKHSAGMTLLREVASRDSCFAFLWYPKTMLRHVSENGLRALFSFVAAVRWSANDAVNHYLPVSGPLFSDAFGRKPPGVRVWGLGFRV